MNSVEIAILVLLVITLVLLIFLLSFFLCVYKNKIIQSKLITYLFFHKRDEQKQVTANKLLKETLFNTLNYLSEHNIGSLIVIEKEISLSLYEETGFKVNSSVSSEFLISIFSNKSASFHDGAVIISKNHISAISCYLPISKTIIDLKYGARHRSAMGISEITDAVAFVVSETTGFISCCINGNLLNLKKEKEKIKNCLERLI